MSNYKLNGFVLAMKMIERENVMRAIARLRR